MFKKSCSFMELHAPSQEAILTQKIEKPDSIIKYLAFY